MKSLLFLLLFPVFCFGQADFSSANGIQDSVAGTSIILKNYEVIFQKVYSSKLNRDELSEKVNSMLSVFKGFRIEDGGAYRNQNEFIGRLYRYQFNERRFKGSVFTGTILSFFVNASVTVQVKDFKYRVIVSNLVFKNVGADEKNTGHDLSLTEYITYKKNTKIKLSKSNLDLADYISRCLSAEFDVLTTIGTDDF
jgi:ribosomal protein L20